MRNAAVRSNLLVPEVREVMDIRQASDYLGISPDTLYKYASEGFVPAFKLGNRWRFKRRGWTNGWTASRTSRGVTEIDRGRRSRCGRRFKSRGQGSGSEISVSDQCQDPKDQGPED